MTIYMKKTTEQAKLPTEIVVNADDKVPIIDPRTGITKKETHLVALRIPEGYYTSIKMELEKTRRDLGVLSSASYKDIVDPRYRKRGSFIVKN